MKTITVPTYEQVSPSNQAIFDNLREGLGFVPNLYATFAHSDTALATYLALQNAKSSLSPKAREVINLVVSQVNTCAYFLAAHTALGKMVGRGVPVHGDERDGHLDVGRLPGRPADAAQGRGHRRRGGRSGGAVRTGDPQSGRPRLVG